MAGTIYDTYNTPTGITQAGDLFVNGGICNIAYGSAIFAAASVLVVNTGLTTATSIVITEKNAGTVSPAVKFHATTSGAYATLTAIGTSLTGTASSGTVNWVAFGS